QFWLAPFAASGDTYYIDDIRLEMINGADTTHPTVTKNEPAGTYIPVSRRINVTFSEPMDQTSVESAFSISPVTKGTFSWNGNTMTYLPNSNLAFETTYTVNIGTGAVDIADNNIQAEHTWQFTTDVVPTSYNIIQNPGFESETYPWIFYSSGKGTFSIVSPGFDGSNSAKLALKKGGTNIQLYQTGVSLEPDTRYRLSFAAYSTTGHDMTVRLFKHVSPYTDYAPEFTANLGKNWQTFTTEFTTKGFTGTVNDGRLQFWFVPFAAGDTYFIDDIRLEIIT
ncbi:MAG: Ig-like domain-containing protein, partial [ANME-2 cluster archaeon]|nr:Ig-like domain-containing protein [ANME-2 cluster archaeon]